MNSLIASRVSDLKSSGIRAVMALAQQREAEGFPVIHLEVGQPDFGTPAGVVNSVINYLRSNSTGYTPNLGVESLRCCVADRYNHNYQLSLTSKNVGITSGAVNALSLSLLAVLEVGDEVLIPDPGWPNYDSCVTLAGGKAISYRLDSKASFSIDLERIKKLIGPKTRAILINFPSNPTGATIKASDLNLLVQLAIENDLYVISDEVYEDFCFLGTHQSAKQTGSYEKLILISGASKSFSMTGWRVGWVVADSRIVSAIGALVEPTTSCPSSVAQHAAEYAIKHSKQFVQEMKNAYAERAKLASNIFTEAGVLVSEPRGAFYLMVDISRTGLCSDRFVKALLAKENVAAAPGSTFGDSSKYMIRVSIATNREQLIEGCHRIVNFINACMTQHDVQYKGLQNEIV